MSKVIERVRTRISLQVSRDRNRRLLEELLSDHDVVDITDTSLEGADLCIVDDRGLSRVDTTLTDWKHDQQPTFAPVLVLSESGGTDPWERYADLLGTQIDTIQPIPASRAAISARVESLLETRHYSQQLASERQFVEQIFDTSPIAKTVLDTDGNIVRANQRAEDVLGLSESELSGRAFDSPEWRIIDENGEPIPSEELPFSQVMETGEPVYGYEHGIERPDGELVWLRVNMALIQAEGKQLTFLVGAFEDITAEKQRRLELKQYESIVELAPDPVLAIDDDQRITVANSAAASTTIYPVEDLIGLDVNQLLTPQEIEASNRHIRERLAGVHDPEPLRFSRTTPGGVRHYEANITPIDDGDESGIEGTVSVARDVTELRNRLQQLQVMDRVLRHNLNNGMNVVLGQAQMIQREESADTAKKAQAIIDHGLQLLTLANKQREITRILSAEPQLGVIDVGEIVLRVAERLAEDYSEADITVSDVENALVHASPNIERAIEELVENALKHSNHEPTEVDLDIDARDELVKIQVADTGPSIPEKEYGVIVDDHEIDQLYHGEGMGLWLAWWISRRSNGTLSFEENEPRGNVVSLELRRAENFSASTRKQEK